MRRAEIRAHKPTAHLDAGHWPMSSILYDTKRSAYTSPGSGFKDTALSGLENLHWIRPQEPILKSPSALQQNPC